MKNSKNNVNKQAVICLCCGVAVSVIVSIAMSLISALLLSKETLPIESKGIIAVIIQYLSALAGGLLVGKCTHNNKIISCGIHAAIYLFVLLGSAAVFLDGISNVAYIGMIACLAGCVSSILLSGMQKATLKKKRRNKRR